MKKIVIAVCLMLGFSILNNAQSYVPELNNVKVIVQPVAPVKSHAFNLKDVKLLDGSAFKNAMDKDASYLLVLEPDRLLYRFYRNAGLPTKGEVYGGWESEGLSGHTLGHYLSACALFYASTVHKVWQGLLMPVSIMIIIRA